MRRIEGINRIVLLQTFIRIVGAGWSAPAAVRRSASPSPLFTDGLYATALAGRGAATISSLPRRSTLGFCHQPGGQPAQEVA